MFNSIVESVLNEISANDAYEKFYSSLPRDNFFGVVNKYGKFDNLMKLIMTSIKDGDSDFNEANSFVDAYLTVDNNVRAEFMRRFQSGEYEALPDAYFDLINLAKNGVESESRLAKSGYIKIYEDENCIITCTLTYSANHHFFGGSTSWCTASDRLGRFDGWIMFLKYTFDKNVGKEYSSQKINFDEVKAGLIQYISKTKPKLKFQFQVYRNGEIGLICDENDFSVCESRVPDYMTVHEILLKNSARVVDETIKMLKIENNYIYNREKFNEKKKQVLQKRIEKKYELLSQKAEKFNIQKLMFLDKKYNEIINSNLLKDYNFISELANFSRDMQDKYDDYYFEPEDSFVTNSDNEIKKFGYLFVSQEYQRDEFSVYVLRQSTGCYKCVDKTENDAVLTERFKLDSDNNNYAIVIVSNKSKSVVFYLFGRYFNFSFLSVGNTQYDNEFCAIEYKDIEKGDIDIIIVNLSTGEKGYLSELTSLSLINNLSEICSVETKDFVVCGPYPYYFEDNQYMTLFTKKPFEPLGDFCTINIDYDSTNGFDALFINRNIGCYLLYNNKIYKINFKFNCNENDISCFLTNDLNHIIITNSSDNVGSIYSFDNFEAPCVSNIKLKEFVDVSEDESNEDGHMWDLRYETEDGIEHVISLAD